MNELKTLDYAPERDRLYRMKEAAPEMYELLKVWTQILAQPTLMIAKEKAKELLNRIDGEDAQS